MNLLRFYRPHCPGNLTFTNKTTATSVKMTNSDLLVKSLNGMVVEDAAADIVLSNEDATINGSLMFKGNVLGEDFLMSHFSLILS